MGTLYIVATPIGNLEDISIRALKILFTVDVIACEDTRNTGQLLKLLQDRYHVMLNSFQHLHKNMNEIPNQVRDDKKPQLISYYDEIEETKSFDIIRLLKDGKNVALVSDAGTPLIADPGYKLINQCIKEGIPIVSIPGASSVTTALTLSGLPINQFLFLGYLPPKHTKRINILTNMYRFIDKSIHIKPTVILFESPHRVSECLEDIQEVFGDIEIVIARELTKVHEEVIREKISNLELKIPQIKGELVILFSYP